LSERRAARVEGSKTGLGHPWLVASPGKEAACRRQLAELGQPKRMGQPYFQSARSFRRYRRQARRVSSYCAMLCQFAEARDYEPKSSNRTRAPTALESQAEISQVSATVRVLNGVGVRPRRLIHSRNSPGCRPTVVHEPPLYMNHLWRTTCIDASLRFLPLSP